MDDMLMEWYDVRISEMGCKGFGELGLGERSFFGVDFARLESVDIGLENESKILEDGIVGLTDGS
jgi:hypothetical protein